MKKITTIICCTLVSVFLNAQSLLPIKYGIKAGINIANISSSPKDGTKNIETSALTGITGGFFMQIPLNDKWHINPELIYTQKGGAFTNSFTHDYVVNQRDLHKTSHELKLAYAELILAFSYKASTKLSLNFGPSFSYLLTPEYSTISDIVENDEEVSTEILPASNFNEESIDIGLNLGISYYLAEDFIIETKVNTGIMNIGNISKIIYTGSTGNDLRTNTYELRNSGVIFSIAYLF
jgi:long-subunit fatty acid transport protein